MLDNTAQDVRELQRTGYMQVLAERNAAEALCRDLIAAYGRQAEAENSPVHPGDAGALKRAFAISGARVQAAEAFSKAKEYLKGTGRYD